MSLKLLLDAEIVAGMMTSWPVQPTVHSLPTNSALLSVVNAKTILDYLNTGCVPPSDINIIKSATPRHPASFVTDGRLDPVKVGRWRDAGCTVHLRHIERWCPPAAVILHGIQRETGCTTYASAFVTPPGEQGLEHHWDQYLGLVVQLAGTKRWELWRPVVDAPTRDYQNSVRRWNPDWPAQWQESGPDLQVDLLPGQVLVLPRGWVHNPHSRESTKTSVHLTVVIQERVPLWIAEHMTGSAINDPSFRAVVPPADLEYEALVARVQATRAALIEHMNGLDVEEFAHALQRHAATEREHAA
jgi:ribosomal protein L16 Arg81 hydroxylase